MLVPFVVFVAFVAFVLDIVAAGAFAIAVFDNAVSVVFVASVVFGVGLLSTSSVKFSYPDIRSWLALLAKSS